MEIVKLIGRMSYRTTEAGHRDGQGDPGRLPAAERLPRDDTYVPMEKQLMMEIPLSVRHQAEACQRRSIPHSGPALRALTKIKYEIPNDQLELLDDYTRHRRCLVLGTYNREGA